MVGGKFSVKQSKISLEIPQFTDDFYFFFAEILIAAVLPEIK